MMRRLKENTEMIENVSSMISESTTIDGNYDAQALVLAAINTTVLVDIAKSLAIIADAVSDFEEE